MGMWSLIAAILPMSLGVPPGGVPGNPQTAGLLPQGNGGLSHLDAHIHARPPAALVRPLGLEEPDTIVKGFDATRERILTAALLSTDLHCRLIRVAVASNGSLTAGLVKLQAGDKRSDLIAMADLEADAARAIRVAFASLPELGHLDVWAIVPGEREFERVHRPVFTLSVARERVAGALSASEDTVAILSRCGCIRVDSLLLEYAIDGPRAVQVHPLNGHVLAVEALDRQWTQFGAQARASGDLDDVPIDGPVSAVVQGRRSGRKVALTIDDGPHPLTTPLTLDVLRREGVRATFFVVGEKVEQYPQLARMIVRGGHELGNHTYSHIPLSKLNPRGVWAQLRGCDAAIERACRVKPRFFRPPGGDCSPPTLRLTDALGYSTVLWTANTGDWQDLPRDQIVANALNHLRPGSIILMHQGDLWSLDALPHIIRGVRRAGLEFETVGDMVGDGPIERREPEEIVALTQRSHIDRW